MVAYATGLRRSDLFGLRWDAIDLEESCFYLEADKTGKSDWRHLPGWAVDHLRRIYCPNHEYVFRGYGKHLNGRPYKELHAIQSAAGVKPFAFHDIRRTACSEIERVRAGLGASFLQHRPRTVTTSSYLNQDEELTEALNEMRVPVGFNSGVKVTEKQEKKLMEQAIRIQPEDFEPIAAKPSEWKFEGMQFRFRGRWFPLKQKRHMEVLKILTAQSEPVSRGDVHKRLKDAGFDIPEHQVTTDVSRLRVKLRKLLGTEKGFDPIPVTNAHSSEPACWTVYIPTWLK